MSSECVCVCVCVCVHMCLSMCACIRMCTTMCAYMYVHGHVSACVCLHKQDFQWGRRLTAVCIHTKLNWARQCRERHWSQKAEVGDAPSTQLHMFLLPSRTRLTNSCCLHSRTDCLSWHRSKHIYPSAGRSKSTGNQPLARRLTHNKTQQTCVLKQFCETNGIILNTLDLHNCHSCATANTIIPASIVP